MDKLRNDSRLMVWKVRILDYLKAQDFISFHIDKSIKGTPPEMGTEGPLETGIVVTG
jgi:hypothetical protein